MTTTRQPLHWARGLPSVVVDGVIALGCCLTVVLQCAVDGELSWWAGVMAVVHVLPLLWRRRHPFATTMLTAVASSWLLMADVMGQFPAAQLVATYTFAALSPPRKRLIAVACTAAGVTGSIVIPEDDVVNLGLVGIAFAMAYALGTAARARQDRIAMLEERAGRLAEQQDAAASRERERIAREMHDILAHSMSLVVVQAEAGPVVVRADPDKAEEIFETISGTAREALTQLRRALGVLRSDPADRAAPQPDLDALAGLVAGVERAGLTTALEETGTRPAVPRDVGTTAYRIVQESLTNTVKHARASRIRIHLDWGDDVLRLTVRDNGGGAAAVDGKRPAAPPVSGHGLIGMRERVSTLGGTLAAGPSDDPPGFLVQARLPLGDRAV